MYNNYLLPVKIPIWSVIVEYIGTRLEWLYTWIVRTMKRLHFAQFRFSISHQMLSKSTNDPCLQLLLDL